MSQSCCSGCGSSTPSPSQTRQARRREVALVVGAIAWFVVGLICVAEELLPRWGEWLWFVPGYLAVGWDVLKTAGGRILRGNAFDETFLMSVATMGALAIGELPEAMAVMLFYRIGEAVQDFAVDRSRDSIRSLLEIRPDVARRKTAAGVERVDPEQVAVGETILVQPGDRVPLDGEILSGQSDLDLSALTGESLPQRVRAGDRVLAGAINQSGAMVVRVTRPFGESSVSRILELVENARQHKAPSERFITRFARRYTPIVVGLALAVALLPPLILPEATMADWGYRALVLLVVSCPCGLVVSIPLGYFGGVGGSAKQGILVKGSAFLDRLCTVGTVVFDKTGTLTEGTFEVTQVRPVDGTSAEDLLYYAAIAESQSTHPIAQSIGRACPRTVEATAVAEATELGGRGVRVTLTPGETVRTVAVGNDRLFPDLTLPPLADAGTVVRVVLDDRYVGDIVVSDRLRADARAAVTGLREVGVGRIAMLTGDRRSVAEAVGRSLALDDVRAERLPEDKSEALQGILRDRTHPGAVAFVGDGINDAPALALADVGVAMGGLGSDAAIETADVVLMADAPSKLVRAIAVARKTRAIVWQNIIFAMSVKVVVIALGAVGLASLWGAVFADMGVALVAIANATRAFRSDAPPNSEVATSPTDSPAARKTPPASDGPKSTA